jgi:hypothetical protein
LSSEGQNDANDPYKTKTQSGQGWAGAMTGKGSRARARLGRAGDVGRDRGDAGRALLFCSTCRYQAFAHSTLFYEARFTGAGCQVPLPTGRIEGGSVFGQYNRIAKRIGPLGEGSQLSFPSAPGDLCWI